MNARMTDDGGFLLGEIDSFLASLFHQLPVVATVSEEGIGGNRIHPLPGEDAEAREDWRELVSPELRRLFESANDTVASDLAELDPTGDEGEFRIPPTHVDAWMNTLNRARLTLAEEFSFSEEDMERGHPSLETPEDLAFIQMTVYGLVLELLVRGQFE